MTALALVRALLELPGDLNKYEMFAHDGLDPSDLERVSGISVRMEWQNGHETAAPLNSEGRREIVLETDPFKP